MTIDEAGQRVQAGAGGREGELRVGAGASAASTESSGASTRTRNGRVRSFSVKLPCARSARHGEARQRLGVGRRADRARLLAECGVAELGGQRRQCGAELAVRIRERHERMIEFVVETLLGAFDV